MQLQNPSQLPELPARTGTHNRTAACQQNDRPRTDHPCTMKFPATKIQFFRKNCRFSGTLPVALVRLRRAVHNPHPQPNSAVSASSTTPPQHRFRRPTLACCRFRRSTQHTHNRHSTPPAIHRFRLLTGRLRTATTKPENTPHSTAQPLKRRFRHSSPSLQSSALSPSFTRTQQCLSHPSLGAAGVFL